MPLMFQEHTGFGRMAAIHDAQAFLSGGGLTRAAPNGKCAIKMLEPSLRIATCLKGGRSVAPNPKAPMWEGTMLEVAAALKPHCKARSLRKKR